MPEGSLAQVEALWVAEGLHFTGKTDGSSGSDDEDADASSIESKSWQDTDSHDLSFECSDASSGGAEVSGRVSRSAVQCKLVKSEAVHKDWGMRQVSISHVPWSCIVARCLEG